MGGGAVSNAFLRGMSQAASSIMACIMLIFSAITKPARWACSCCSRPGKDDIGARDLELGDPERERWRDSGGAGRESRRSTNSQNPRGTPQPDEFDVYGNPWYKISLDSLVGPRSVRVPTPSVDIARSLFETRDSGELLHPDVFYIGPDDEANTLTGTTAENTPGASSSVNFGLVPLRAISTLDLDYYEGEDDTGGSKATTAATRSFAAADSDSTAPSSCHPSFSESLPFWLVARKVTAGITASRFVEVDVDSPDIAPPDFGLIAEQQELLERGLVGGRTRGRTWTAGQERDEEPPERAMARHSV